jgi:hypothetical protein
MRACYAVAFLVGAAACNGNSHEVRPALQSHRADAGTLIATDGAPPPDSAPPPDGRLPALPSDAGLPALPCTPVPISVKDGGLMVTDDGNAIVSF